MTAEAKQPNSRCETAHTPVILLVEDEAIVRDVTRDVLVHAGYLVLESGTPAEALEVASHYKGEIDLLLTDMVMPGMNGTELADYLHRLRPGIIAVFMSGYADVDVVEKIRHSSAIHIQKPFTVNMLLSGVGKALEAGVPAG